MLLKLLLLWTLHLLQRVHLVVREHDTEQLNGQHAQLCRVIRAAGEPRLLRVAQRRVQQRGENQWLVGTVDKLQQEIVVLITPTFRTVQNLTAEHQDESQHVDPRQHDMRRGVVLLDLRRTGDAEPRLAPHQLVVILLQIDRDPVHEHQRLAAFDQSRRGLQHFQLVRHRDDPRQHPHGH